MQSRAESKNDEAGTQLLPSPSAILRAIGSSTSRRRSRSRVIVAP